MARIANTNFVAFKLQLLIFSNFVLFIVLNNFFEEFMFIGE